MTKLSFASKDLSFVGPRSCFAKRFDHLGIITEEEVRFRPRCAVAKRAGDVLTAHLAAILEKTHRHLVADDYNFLVRQFNEARKKK